MLIPGLCGVFLLELIATLQKNMQVGLIEESKLSVSVTADDSSHPGSAWVGFRSPAILARGKQKNVIFCDRL